MVKRPSFKLGSELMAYDPIVCWETAGDEGASASPYAINEIGSVRYSHFNTRTSQ